LYLFGQLTEQLKLFTLLTCALWLRAVTLLQFQKALLGVLLRIDFKGERTGSSESEVGALVGEGLEIEYLFIFFRII
jgi:hypothetical protein